MTSKEDDTACWVCLCENGDDFIRLGCPCVRKVHLHCAAKWYCSKISTTVTGDIMLMGATLSYSCTCETCQRQIPTEKVKLMSDYILKSLQAAGVRRVASVAAEPSRRVHPSRTIVSPLYTAYVAAGGPSSPTSTAIGIVGGAAIPAQPFRLYSFRGLLDDTPLGVTESAREPPQDARPTSSPSSRRTILSVAFLVSLIWCSIFIVIGVFTVLAYKNRISDLKMSCCALAQNVNASAWDDFSRHTCTSTPSAAQRIPLQ